jgi:hypothetical protein
MSAGKSKEPHVLLTLKAAGGKPTSEHLKLLDHPDDEVKREAMSLIMDIPKRKLKELIHHPVNKVALLALHHPSVYEPHLIHALESENPIIHAAVAGHPKITEHAFRTLMDMPHVPVETKMHAVSNKECEPHWLTPVLMDATDAEHDDRHRMAISAMFHPMMPEETVVDFLHQAQCPMMRKMAALNVRNPDTVMSLLESDKLPMSVKSVLMSGKHFDASNWWKIKDPDVRSAAKRMANVE